MKHRLKIVERDGKNSVAFKCANGECSARLWVPRKLAFAVLVEKSYELHDDALEWSECDG